MVDEIRSVEESDTPGRKFWKTFRKWRMLAISPALFLILLMTAFGERNERLQVPAMVVMAVGGILLVLLFFVEQIAWSVIGQGHPCVHCGGMVRQRSFRFTNSKCPHCHRLFDQL